MNEFFDTREGNQLLQAVLSFESMQLESELKSILEVVVPHHHSISPFLNRLGWNGSRQVTLQSAGDELGVSRERVRQIQDEIEATLHASNTWAPALEAAVDTLLSETPFPAEKTGEILFSKGHTLDNEFDFQSLMKAVEVVSYRRRHDLTTVTSTVSPRVTLVFPDGGYSGDREFGLIIKILDEARPLLNRYGILHITELPQKPVEQLEMLRISIEELLEGITGIKSAGSGWFVNTQDHSRNPIVNRLRKLSALSPSISIEDSANQLSRDINRGRFIAGPDLALIVDSIPGWSSAGGVLSAPKKFELSELVEPAEFKMLSLLNRNPGRLYRELVPISRRHKIGQASFRQFLFNSILVKSEGSRRTYRYSLIGTIEHSSSKALSQEQTVAEPVDENGNKSIAIESRQNPFGHDPDGLAESAAMEVVTMIERSKGRIVRDVSTENLGWDIESTGKDPEDILRIEIKGRVVGADSITVTTNEITGYFRHPDQYILAIVQLSPSQPPLVTYVFDAFESALEPSAISAQYRISRLINNKRWQHQPIPKQITTGSII